MSLEFLTMLCVVAPMAHVNSASAGKVWWRKHVTERTDSASTLAFDHATMQGAPGLGFALLPHRRNTTHDCRGLGRIPLIALDYIYG